MHQSFGSHFIEHLSSVNVGFIFYHECGCQ